ncbi:MAG: hypothetical protein WDN72_03405 [Alphaproteobacteria bacterium]
MSDSFTDFFRGVLNDNPGERWGLEQLAQWLSGKRFNMIAPAAPKETTRPIAFAGENYFGGRLLANAFHRQWDDAVKDVKSMRLDRWCEMSLHRPEMSERVERALRIAGEASTEKHVSDMMTRIIAIFDPVGPIRTRSLALRPDGIGPLLAWLVREDLQGEMNELVTVIDTDVANYWADLSEFAKSAPENSQTLWRPAARAPVPQAQDVRLRLRARALRPQPVAAPASRRCSSPTTSPPPSRRSRRSTRWRATSRRRPASSTATSPPSSPARSTWARRSACTSSPPCRRSPITASSSC